MINRKFTALVLTLVIALTFSSCREDHLIVYAEDTDTGKEAVTGGDIVGMYVLNEGNMGSNKCTLDFLDLSGNSPTVHYWRNIYSERNPSVVKELGDVGNDIQLYGSRMWIVVNCSDKVEVVRADDCQRIGQVNIPNCRNVVFHDRYAYVSSYVGPVDLQAEAQIGMVYQVDTLSLEIVNTVQVGYQPEEMAVVGDRLYVANSGGYIAPVYDHTVSVVNLNTFSEERKMNVGVNLHRCRADRYDQLWVTSRGNYSDQNACLYWLEKDAHGEMTVGGSLPHAVSDLCIVGDSLYFFGSEWNEEAQRNTISFGIVNVRTHQLVADRLTTAPEVAAMRMPYGIIVNPQDRDFYLMDAKNYVSSGELLHFLSDGTFDWKVTTGDIPAHAAFVTSKNIPQGGGDTPGGDENRNLIQAVDEYVPAPGQFVNTLPEATADDTLESMLRKCTERLANGAGDLVTLGGWGGYLTFHFQHPVVNAAGQRDFAIWGNTFTGNSEPGIVLVSTDDNHNGKPDDEWYELKGSEYTNATHNYQLTYTYRSMQDIPWADNQGNTGVLPRNGYHEQEYFPLWLTGKGMLTFSGSRLPDNATAADGSYTLHAFGYGYADNYPNSNREGCAMDIGWAVDNRGNSVQLTHIDFVRVYNGMHQVCGNLGETSTEITGAEDLHPRLTTASNSPLYY